MSKLNLKNGQTKLYKEPIKYFTLQTKVNSKKSCITERQGKYFKIKNNTVYIANGRYVDVMVSPEDFFTSFDEALKSAGVKYKEQYKRKLFHLEKQTKRMKDILLNENSFQIVDIKKINNNTLLSYQYGENDNEK